MPSPDSTRLLECLCQPALIKPDDAALWEEWINQFPYFVPARWLQQAQQQLYPVPQPLQVKKSLLPFVEDPLRLSAFLFNLQAIPSVDTKMEVTEVAVSVPEEMEEQKETLPEEADVLEWIQGLPDTPFAEIDTQHVVSGTPAMEEPVLEKEDQSLMVMMSFMDWLRFFKQKSEREAEESREKKALKVAWQKVKLAEMADEELEEIPEPLFKQAMDSVSTGPELASESLAAILASQGKKDRAIAMYKKLSLRDPGKSAYFAHLIQELNSHSL